MKRFFAAIATAAAAVSAPALAQSRQPEAASRILQSFKACQQLGDEAAQLACFNGATDTLSREIEAKEVTILDRSDIRATRRSLFGFPLPRIKLFGGDRGEDDEPEFTQIETTIARVRPLEYGKLSFTLPDNAVWQTTEAVRKRPRVGDKVRIKQGAMGSYFISFDGGRSIKGMRVN